MKDITTDSDSDLKDITTESSRWDRCNQCWFGDERGPQIKKCGQSPETRKSEEIFLPKNL